MAIDDPNSGMTSEQQRQMELQNQQMQLQMEQKKAEMMKAQGLNPDGSPIKTAYQSITDPTTGQLKSQYQLNISPLSTANMQGYNKFSQEAMRSGPSAWAQLQQQGVQNNLQQNKSSAARQAYSGMNQGLQNLAMRGGASGASRAMLARGSMRDLVNARQGAGLQAQTQGLGIQTTDEGNRIQQLGQLASSEQDIGKYNKSLEGKVSEFNMNSLLQDQRGKSAYDFGSYQEQMKKWAADKQAEATAKSGGGGK
jgi:hypothetical protein